MPESSPAVSILAAPARGAVAAATVRASISLTAYLQADARVLVTVRTNAKKVTLKYKLGRKTKTKKLKVRAGTATALLPKGVPWVTAVTKKARGLKASPKLKAVPIVAPAPAPAPPAPPAPGGGAGGSTGGGTVTPPAPGGPATPPQTSSGAIRRVNTTPGGLAGNSESGSATISNDGSLVAFYSRSTDLVSGGDNGQYHVYVKNLSDGSLRLVDRGPGGVPADASGAASVTANKGLAFSPDGQWLAFCSTATNLALGAPLVGYGDLYRVNLASGAVGWLAPGCRSPQFSPDGMKIAWTTSYAWLPAFDQDSGDEDVYAGFLPAAIDQWLNPVAMVSSNSGGIGLDSLGVNQADDAEWSPDSTKVAFTASITKLVPGDTNVADDVFVKTMGADLNSDTIDRISTTPAGGQGDAASDHPSWSPDGTRIAFASLAGNLSPSDVNAWADIFSKNLASGAVELISAGLAGESSFQRHKSPKWSPDGTRIAYSAAFVDGSGFDSQSQVYVKNLVTGWRQEVSTGATGVAGNSASTLWDAGNVWSPDSTRMIFMSNATNFVEDNNAFQQDVFEKTVGTP